MLAKVSGCSQVKLNICQKATPRWLRSTHHNKGALGDQPTDTEGQEKCNASCACARHELKSHMSSLPCCISNADLPKRANAERESKPS